MGNQNWMAQIVGDDDFDLEVILVVGMNKVATTSKGLEPDRRWPRP
jgi:hypothetical protein